MTRWRGPSWLMFAAVAALNLGVNILAHVDDPREIRQYLGGWLVALGATTIIMLVVPEIWQHLHLTRKLAAAWAVLRSRSSSLHARLRPPPDLPDVNPAVHENSDRWKERQ